MLAALWMFSAPAQASENDSLDLEPLLVREPERRPVDVDRIDTENFEVGIFGGVMSVEDFGTNPVYGLRLTYHINEDFFVEGSYGRTRLDQTSFEELSGGAQLLTDSERDMSFYGVSVGYNVLPGESFVGRRYAFKGGLYLLGGAGSTEFGGDDRFTVNLGFGYRFIPTDWMALHLNVRDHIFDSDLLGKDETRHNLELSTGVTLFF
jgi:outer membrane beta-barrel protein